MSTHAVRIDAALAVVTQHNSVVGPENRAYIDPDRFRTAVVENGGTSDAGLAAFTFEDIARCFFNQNPDPVRPLPLARQIANIFRSPADERPVTAKKADRMTPAELVAAFDPRDPDNAVGRRLREISRDQPFLVYRDGQVNTEASAKLLREVQQGFPPLKIYTDSAGVYEVHRVGVIPDNYADENPLYPGRPLRPDGTCDQTNRSWEGVALATRQLVRLAVESGQLLVTLQSAHDTLDLVIAPNGDQRLKQRYPAAVVDFDRRQKTGGLPSLRVLLAPGVKKLQDGRKVSWNK